MCLTGLKLSIPLPQTSKCLDYDIHRVCMDTPAVFCNHVANVTSRASQTKSIQTRQIRTQPPLRK